MFYRPWPRDSHIPPNHCPCTQDTTSILFDHLQYASCICLFASWTSGHCSGPLPHINHLHHGLSSASLLRRLSNLLSWIRNSSTLAISTLTWRILLYPANPTSAKSTTNSGWLNMLPIRHSGWRRVWRRRHPWRQDCIPKTSAPLTVYDHGLVTATIPLLGDILPR